MKVSAKTAFGVLLGAGLVAGSPQTSFGAGDSEQFAEIPEITFKLPGKAKLPSRRLSTDPDQPEFAPEAVMIEAAAITDGADTAMRLAIKANNASVLEYGVNDARMAIPLTNLALMRLKAGKPEFALKDLQRVEVLLDQDRKVRDERRVEAAYARGASYFELGVISRAIEAFEDGLQRVRTIDGLDGPGQIDFLRALILSNRVIGDTKAADRWQVRRVEVAEAAYLDDADRLAWHYVDAGRWFRDVGRVEDAMALHAKAVEVVTARHGSQSSRLLGPYLDLAMSSAVMGPNAGAASFKASVVLSRSLSRVREILALGMADDPDRRVKSHRQSADIHWIFGRTIHARRLYSTAARLAKESGQQRYTELDRPAFLIFHPPRGKDIEELGAGNLVTRFGVDRRGRVRGVDILDGGPDYFRERVKRRLVRALKRATLRPRFVEGKPVATEAVRYEYAMPAG